MSINFASHWFDSAGIQTHDPSHRKPVLLTSRPYIVNCWRSRVMSTSTTIHNDLHPPRHQSIRPAVIPISQHMLPPQSPANSHGTTPASLLLLSIQDIRWRECVIDIRGLCVVHKRQVNTSKRKFVGHPCMDINFVRHWFNSAGIQGPDFFLQRKLALLPIWQSCVVSRNLSASNVIHNDYTVPPHQPVVHQSYGHHHLNIYATSPIPQPTATEPQCHHSIC